MAKNLKKKWIKPTLLILTKRNEGQENVLLICKIGGVGDGSAGNPDTYYMICRNVMCMTPCDDLVSS